MKKIIITTTLIVLVLAGGIFLLYRLINAPNIDPDTGGEPQIQENINRPLPPEFMHDKDRDGIDDEREKELGTSDLSTDTDGDGLRDILEIEKFNTDPTKEDTDGDGFYDGYEILNGFDPNVPAESRNTN